MPPRRDGIVSYLPATEKGNCSTKRVSQIKPQWGLEPLIFSLKGKKKSEGRTETTSQRGATLCYCYPKCHQNSPPDKTPNPLHQPICSGGWGYRGAVPTCVSITDLLYPEKGLSCHSVAHRWGWGPLVGGNGLLQQQGCSSLNKHRVRVPAGGGNSLFSHRLAAGAASAIRLQGRGWAVEGPLHPTVWTLRWERTLGDKTVTLFKQKTVIFFPAHFPLLPSHFLCSSRALFLPFLHRIYKNCNHGPPLLGR